MMPSEDEAFHDQSLPLEQRARLLRQHLGNAASDYTDDMLGKILLMSEEHREGRPRLVSDTHHGSPGAHDRGHRGKNDDPGKNRRRLLSLPRYRWNRRRRGSASGLPA